jgi:cardiolipin synthase A/B
MSAKNITGSNRFSVNNEVKLIRSGSGYFILMEELIDKARYSIHLQTYIFKDDETGNGILDALSRAARRGVETYLIADGYASRTLSPATINLLTEAGVHFRFFEPLFKSDHFYFGRRMHHKALVVDARYALIGGMNIANHYNVIKGELPWLDYALNVEGEAAIRIHEICKSIWGKHIRSVDSIEAVKAYIPQKDWCSVRIRENDWLKGKRQVWRSYFDLFNNARESITIVCSYFLPGRVLRKRLAKAAQRGVKVKVILAGPSDVMLAKYAERYLYHWMWRNGIEIYEYQPSVLHAKMAIADGKWLVLGSYNINNISTYASVELNLEVRSRKLGAAVNEELKLVLTDCTRIEPESILTPGKLIRNFFQKLSFEVVRMLLGLFTFYFKPKH